MNVCIVGFQEEDKETLRLAMESMIEQSQCYLFNVLCAGRRGVAYEWAQENGAPVIVINNDLNEIIKETDFLLACYDGSPMMHTLIFKYLQTGKHGRVVEKEKWS